MTKTTLLVATCIVLMAPVAAFAGDVLAYPSYGNTYAYRAVPAEMSRYTSSGQRIYYGAGSDSNGTATGGPVGQDRRP